MWKLVFQYIQFGFAFWNRIFFFKKIIISGNMLVSLVSASVVWFCFSEYKIKHKKKMKKKKKRKKRSERGNWSSSMVWFCLLEQKIRKKKIVEICWSLQFLLVQFGLAFWNIKLTKTKRGQNVEIGLLVQFGFAFWEKKKKTGKFVGIFNFSQFSLVFLFEIEN